MNKVVLLGRLTKTPEVRVSGETTIARFTLAVDRKVAKTEEQTADFISIIAFNKKAEFAEKYLGKGSKIAVVGRIQTGSYTNKDNVKVYTTDVVAEDIEFADSKKGNEVGMSDADIANAGFQAINADIEELPFN